MALHWAVHASDPDLSLTSLRAFAVLADGCDAALLRTLALSLAGATRMHTTTHLIQLTIQLTT